MDWTTNAGNAGAVSGQLFGVATRRIAGICGIACPILTFSFLSLRTVHSALMCL
jgi:hypothetical protein